MGLQAVLTAMQLTDSALPTGGFTHSYGFETYLESGVIHDADTFARWLQMFCAQQLTVTDALAVRLAYAASSFARISRLDHVLAAQAVPQQIRVAGAMIGQRMLTIAGDNYGSEWLNLYREGVDAGELHGHPALVWAIVARDAGIDEETAVAQHVYAAMIALVHNAVRAIPLGQTAGQQVIHKAQAWVEQCVARSATLEENDLGAIAPGLEIAQMLHEKQRARMFMS